MPPTSTDELAAENWHRGDPGFKPAQLYRLNGDRSEDERQGPCGPCRFAQAFLHAVCPPAGPDAYERRVLSRELPQHASHGSLRDVELCRELGERR